MTTSASAQKIENKLNSLEASVVFEILKELSVKDTEEAAIVYCMAVDVYMNKVSESAFIKAMELLDDIMANTDQ